MCKFVLFFLYLGAYSQEILGEINDYYYKDYPSGYMGGSVGYNKQATNSKIEGGKSQIEDTKSEIEELINKIQKNMISQIEALVKEIEKQANENVQIKNDIVQINTKLTELENENKIIKSENDRINDKLNICEKVEKDNVRILGKLKTMENENAICTRKIVDINAKLVKLENENKNIKNENDRDNDELSQKLAGENDRINGKLTKVENENDDLSGRLTKLEHECTKLAQMERNQSELKADLAKTDKNVKGALSGPIVDCKRSKSVDPDGPGPYLRRKTLTYDTCPVDNSMGGMNKNNGIFTVPANQDGIYQISFTTKVKDKGVGSLRAIIKVGNKEIGDVQRYKTIDQNNGEGYISLAQIVYYPLRAGDKVWIQYLYSKGYWMYSENSIHFTIRKIPHIN